MLIGWAVLVPMKNLAAPPDAAADQDRVRGLKLAESGVKN